MIGQYVFTRNNGNVIIGPHGNSGEGLSCVGRTESIRQEDLLALNGLSVYTRAVRKADSREDYLPHWCIHWLPSGSLAVGKVTYFPPDQKVRQRNNHIAHFYVLDPQTAFAVSEELEQLFTLPFIDYDLTYHTPEHDMEILTKLRDYETLQECGAVRTQAVPLGTLLNQHLPLYTDEVRNIVEAVCDSVVHGNRQTLFTYDCYTDNAQWLCAQWLGWIYRLLPLQIRTQANIAFPYNENAAGDAHLSLIPQSLVRVRNGYASYSSSDDANASTVPMGFNYLFADSTFFHQPDVQSQLPELYNAQSNYFCAFLQKQIDALYDSPDPQVNAQLQTLYRDFYRQGWRDSLLLDSADGLELMITTLGNLDQLMPLSPEDYEQELYFWMEHLGRIMAERALPLPLCLSIQRNLLMQLYQDGKIAPNSRWLGILAQVLETTQDPTLAADCVDWASIASAKLLDQGENALALAKERFSHIRCAGSAVDRLIFMQLMTEGTPERQLAWQKAGVSCDAEAAMQRVIRYVMANMRACNDCKSFFSGFEKSAQLINLLPAGLLEKMRQYLIQFTSGWIKQGHLTSEMGQLEFLLSKVDQTQNDPANLSVLENAIAKLMARSAMDMIRCIYQSAGIAELKELRERIQETRHPLMRRFLSELYSTLLDRIRSDLMAAPADRNLIHRCAELLSVSSEEHDWKVYDRVCGVSIGLISSSSVPSGTAPDFLTPQWLAELRQAGVLRFRKGYRYTITICALDHLLNDIALTPQLSALIRPDTGGADIDRIRANMFRSGRFLPPHQMLFGLFQRTAISGLTNADAVVLLETYSLSHFIKYLDWLRDNRRGGREYLGTLHGLAVRKDLLRNLDQEAFLSVMEHLNRTY